MTEDKPILSIETSESICGVCVFFTETKYFESQIYLKNSHAEKLFETIDYVMRSAGIETSDLGGIAVSSGPGSFTGLRIGLSAAKGIAFGSSLPITPVPTFEAMALQLAAILPDGSEFLIANKVNMEEIYYAKFKINLNNYIFVENLQIINHDDFRNLAKDTLTFGNVNFDNSSDKIESKNIFAAPSPKYVAIWSKTFGADLTTFNYEYLEPNYLKKFIIKERKNG
jgi:tRNA threonylcarbamoyladenosine biosynthesis protein TsaB